MENHFKVDFGNGEEIFTHTELTAKFMTMTEKEKKSFYDKKGGCTSLVHFPEKTFGTLHKKGILNTSLPQIICSQKGCNERATSTDGFCDVHPSNFIN